ncbi:MAG: DUF4432 domain-containing protein, partial [Deltaproteobacteria bacterium]|nr:DUF4432 domain-containing protein [Deltaproteobacteria bacterium]
MMGELVVYLRHALFGDKQRVLAEYHDLSAIAFRYESGVCGLRLENERGHVTLLPFQGQQIWDVAFEGRTLTMRSMFTEPRPTPVYLETYGGFLLHC